MGDDRSALLSGSDTLNGGEGADDMRGGKGNDRYMVDNVGDKVTEDTGGTLGGRDIVEASVSFTLAKDIENLTLTGTADINGTSNTLANTMIGNIGKNTLNRGAGDDVLNGGVGDDILIGLTTTTS